MLAATTAMLGVALAAPGAFRDDAVLFGAAYLLVRVLHFVLSAIVSRDDPHRRGVLLRFAPTAILGASLILLAGFLEGRERIAAWVVARPCERRANARVTRKCPRVPTVCPHDNQSCEAL
jgi:low temperature requirement protein LtrA